MGGVSAMETYCVVMIDSQHNGSSLCCLETCMAFLSKTHKKLTCDFYFNFYLITIFENNILNPYKVIPLNFLKVMFEIILLTAGFPQDFHSS